ncbi:hypothetical protein EhV420 [Emiliania huxleyi virus 86]|uniref:Uncharacterized protein n=1 Tax=Emiliania huxleyi virus 86 (isolate United Kingdom/English Channel/1999) TaxID=654925 RepID=Q4A259_EHV8U|nr:hypothetical protein EhV420 [Emiliania huxleyi virus 86]AHA56047.1 hypothetical protein EhV164_00460 [Emiliania huxleyi virus 164]CAI65847.1 hypothetical protein EhV420 [Emiliania huxleyi virus 86]CAZ69750.1 hypothetical protein [Emiliania huxleyi virus 99B1]
MISYTILPKCKHTHCCNHTMLHLLVMYMSYLSCGSYYNGDTIINIYPSIRRCNTVGTVPQVKTSVNSPNLSLFGRRDPIIVLDIIKSRYDIDLSIIMSSFNSPDALNKSLTHILTHSTTAYELVIVLEGNIDASLSNLISLRSRFASSTCKRMRAIHQPTPIYETSSNNIGMFVSNPNIAYALTQPDIYIYEHGWDYKILDVYKHNANIFGISGRCAHDFDESNKIGKCGKDVEYKYNAVHSNSFHERQTANRGPLFLRRNMTHKLGYLDERRFVLEGSDHDLFRRSYSYGWKVGYVSIGIYSPLNDSPRRNFKLSETLSSEYITYQKSYKEQRISNTMPSVVTALDISHVEQLLCLLTSLWKSGVYDVTVYIIGTLDKIHQEYIRSSHVHAHIIPFDFDKYPPHVRMTSQHYKGHYAWKPLIVSEMLETRTDVVWLDAGTRITNTNAIYELMNLARQYGGVYSPASTGIIAEWTHPGMVRYFNERYGTRHVDMQHSNCNAAMISFSKSGQFMDEIVREWKECALDINCIEPTGASRANHRQDQSALTIILARISDTYNVPHSACSVDGYDSSFYKIGLGHRECDTFNLLNPSWYWIKSCT